jgi:hypothetical protein
LVKSWGAWDRSSRYKNILCGMPGMRCAQAALDVLGIDTGIPYVCISELTGLDLSRKRVRVALGLLEGRTRQVAW